MKANQGPDTYQYCSADKAVDGDTSNTAGNCAHTTVGYPAWWRVDLAKRFLVTGLKLFNRARGRTYLRIFIFIIHLDYVGYAFFYLPNSCYCRKPSMGAVRCPFCSNFSQFYGAITCLTGGRNNRKIKRTVPVEV